MRLKTAALVILVFAAAGLGLKKIATSSQEEEKWEDRNSVRAVARRNKAKGASRIAISGPIIDYPGLNSGVDDLLRNYSVVIAQPIAMKGYLVNSHSIGTWYKFRISEAISLKPPRYCNTCPELGTPPEELGSTLSNEFLLTVDGGTLLIEGVEVTQSSASIPRFEEAKNYLLFLSFLPGGVARLAAGPAAIYRVQDNYRFDGIDTHKYRAYEEVKNRFKSRLSMLKSQINR